MLNRVVAILSSLGGMGTLPIEPESSLADDLGLDSLSVTSLIVRLEEEFGIEIPDRQITQFVTVGDIVAYLER